MINQENILCNNEKLYVNFIFVNNHIVVWFKYNNRFFDKIKPIVNQELLVDKLTIMDI